MGLNPLGSLEPKGLEISLPRPGPRRGLVIRESDHLQPDFLLRLYDSIGGSFKQSLRAAVEVVAVVKQSGGKAYDPVILYLCDAGGLDVHVLDRRSSWAIQRGSGRRCSHAQLSPHSVNVLLRLFK